MGGWRYNWISALNEVSGQFHASAAFFPAKTARILIAQEDDWAPEPVWELWRIENSHAPVGNRIPNRRSSNPQPSRYADSYSGTKF
jgi:hypothetical protein